MNPTRLLLNFKNIRNISTSSRSYAFKSDLKIKWVRPVKIPCIDPKKSGDLKPLDPIDTKEYGLMFKDSKELEDADDIVKQLYTLEYLPRGKRKEVIENNLIKNVQRHPYDFHSMEVKIARMTVTIRNLQKVKEESPKNVRMNVCLKEIIDKRKKFLKYLRRWDYKRFEWLLEKLDLVYKPPPNKFHWITRKDSLRKLTDKYCDDLKNERLDAYRKELEAQQEGFLRDKIKKLEFIRQEQIDCDVPVTIEQKEIDETRRQLDELLKERQAQAAT